MSITHNLGFPRIGPKRELKFACEAYWRGEKSADELLQDAAQIRELNWQLQLDQGVDLLPVGDFSLYDHVLDTSALFGNLPQRISKQADVSALDQYFLSARGRAPTGNAVAASEMTKWFDTNYHYLVPEFNESTQFSLHSNRLIDEIRAAKKLTPNVKPVLLGPLTYLWLGKYTNDPTSVEFNKLSLLDNLLVEYVKLLAQLHEEGIDWVQIDEPILVLDLNNDWLAAFDRAYNYFSKALSNQQRVKLLLATYFGPLLGNLSLVLRLPVDGVHIDAVRGKQDIPDILENIPTNKVLSIGVVDGRNIWKSDLTNIFKYLEPIKRKLKERFWIAPSCSLLHSPVDLDSEDELNGELKDWFSFAKQKLTEVVTLRDALFNVKGEWRRTIDENSRSITRRMSSQLVHDLGIKDRVSNIEPSFSSRLSNYPVRAEFQRERFNLPLYPTTTIGSFPQTKEIRAARRDFKQDKIGQLHYDQIMRNEIFQVVKAQEEIGLDVLVHGEAERNDMVEYFGEQLKGYTFTKFGWVQSYGSRCVKPPIIYGDVSREKAITVEWSRYAQSLTDKPVKGMLTGPITMLQWAFVRDDQPREITAKQIALALRDEVSDLEQAGINIIQVDEPALREGLPLRRADWSNYLSWAVEAFKISTCSVADETQIHTHMCYAEFNDIIQAIADLDADVITIETSRSNMELLDAFSDFNYPNEIGPGVYDIHSPNVPTAENMISLMQRAAADIPASRLWVNPDCGLKTRGWEEVTAALKEMVLAAKALRQKESKAA